jgi:hypothetical protein
MELRGQVHQVCGGRETEDVSPLKWRDYCNPAGSPITALSGLPGIQIASSPDSHKPKLLNSTGHSSLPCTIEFQRLDHNPKQQSHDFCFCSPYSPVSICQTHGSTGGQMYRVRRKCHPPLTEPDSMPSLQALDVASDPNGQLN